MTQLEHDYDDVLRRVLHAAADLVEPSADGLERIRARLTRPQPAVIAWLLAGYSDLVTPARGWAQSAVNRAQPVLNWLRPFLGRLQPFLDRLRVALGSVIERFRPARPDAAHPRRRYAWLRPAAAMGTAVFVVAMGAFALTALPQVISSSNVFVLPFTGGGPAGPGGAGGANGHGAPLSGPQVFPPPSFPGSQSPRTEVAPTCSVAPSTVPPSASPSPSTVPPSASPNPTTPPPSASPNPTTPPPTSPSSSPSPSPSPSASNSDPVPPPSSPAPAEGSDAAVTSVPAASPTPAAVVATLDAAPGPSSPAAAPCGPAPTKAAPTKSTSAARGNAQAKLG